MRTCLLQITGYRQLYQDVENVRKKPYDSANAQHERLLLKVSPVRARGSGSFCPELCAFSKPTRPSCLSAS